MPYDKKAYQKSWRQDNKQHRTQYSKLYRESHTREKARLDKVYYQKHRQQILERCKLYRQNHKQQMIEYDRQYNQSHRQHRTSWHRQYIQMHPQIARRAAEYHKIYRQKARLSCLQHYSDGKLECACCHEKIYEFLSLDHVNGGGKKHRKELGINSGTVFYRWIIKNNFPEGYRVLCMNCNFAIGNSRSCPHSQLITEDGKCKQ